MSTAVGARRARLYRALIGGLAAASLISIPVQAAEPPAHGPAVRSTEQGPTVRSGSVQGLEACILEVAASDEVWGSAAHVVPEEQFYLYGEGWAASSEVDLTVAHLPSGDEEYWIVPVDAAGVLAAGFVVSPGNYGTFRFTVTQADPACEAIADVRALPLTDILDSKFLRNIKWLYVEGITAGCGGERFCPDGRVTRAQMASFLSRALDLPATSQDYFTDDETNKHEANINRLRAAGITFGCSATRFCPDGIVTRGQMASFLARAFSLQSTTTDYFTDDETNKHEANINRLRAARITYGCSATTFCPEGAVTRGQMAAFLHRAMD